MEEASVLVIRPVQAILTHDTEWFLKMDPYVEFIIGRQGKYMTKICKRGGKTPKWKDVITHLGKREPYFELTVYDKDYISDDLIGFTNVSLDKVYELGKESGW